MTLATELKFSFADAIKKDLGTQSSAFPFVITNREALTECIELGFKLKRIYGAWMKHFEKPPFSFRAFRYACIKQKIYQPKPPKNAVIPAPNFPLDAQD